MTQFIEKDLKLIVNQEKSQVGSPTRLKFLSCLICRMNEVCHFRQTGEAKKKFEDKLRQVTKRNRSDTFQDFVKEIKLLSQGWINYFGLGHITVLDNLFLNV